MTRQIPWNQQIPYLHVCAWILIPKYFEKHHRPMPLPRPSLVALKKKNASLEKELHKKDHELKIETSLEKVRVVAMAMKEASDMLKICRSIAGQLKLLGVQEIRNVQTAIIFQEKGTYLNYEFYARHRKEFTTEVHYDNHPMSNAFVNQMLGGPNGFFSKSLKKKEVAAWYAFQKTTNQFADKFLEEAQSLSYYWYSLGPVALGISTYKPLSKEEQKMFMRFRNVFSLAYNRFLDIEKAENRAREAKIEASLERVRSGAMAMESSMGLSQIIEILYNEFNSLDFSLDRVFIMTFDSQANGSTWWMGSQEEGTHNKGYFVPFHDQAPNLAQWRGWKVRKKKWHYHLKGEEKKNWDKFLFFDTGLTDLPAPAKEYMQSVESVHLSASFENFGGLVAATKAPLKDNQFRILQRFAKVFDLAYTRFNDLKQAEQRAREAQIELALERVRARSMAMHASNELAEVATLLFEQAKWLGISSYASGFNIWDKDQVNLISWMSNPTGSLNPPFEMPIQSYDQHQRLYESWKKNEIFLEDDLAGDVLKRHYDFLWSFPLLEKAFRRSEVAGFKTPERQVHNAAFFSHGYLLFITEQPCPQFHSVFKRFAKVFDQTYTRFLDLQKAEAQAREARIEAALERIRSRSLAMHKSDELKDVIAVVFEKLKELGLVFDASAIQLFSGGSKDSLLWVASTNVIAEPLLVNLPYEKEALEDSELFQNVWQARKSGDDIYNKTYSFDEKNKYYEYVLKNNPQIPTSVAQRMLESSGYTHTVVMEANSAMIADSWAGKTFAKEEINLLKRIARVFEQAYTRFLDLQKAEAQSREAQIQLALERVRARTMAMQHSDELSEAVFILFQQFKELGENPDQATIGIVNEEERVIEYWVTMYGNRMDRVFKFTFDEPHVTRKIYEGWKNKEKSIVIDLSGRALREFTSYRASQGGAAANPDEKRRLINVAFFAKGLLNVQSSEARSDESIRLLERFAGVFDQTYTRFLDLQKAEAQTREAQIETALERVRSRTLAMQRSEELAETAAVLFTQLINLGIEPNRLIIGIIKDHGGESEFWITDEDGTKVSAALYANLNDNVSFKKMLDGWIRQEKSLIIDMQGEELATYFHHLTKLHVPFKGGLDQKRRIQYIAYFSKGFIEMASPDEQPPATLELLERFAYAFNLTFTRFNDLKIAEAHALQAEQDLEEIKAAKKKAENTLAELRLTQKQLIQSEKMASLGELTAGIAHEIQNPLNFVNNFSEVSNELLDEMNEEMSRGNFDEAKTIAENIRQNLDKINHHGKRADGIVKAMLQHSRSGSGQKELTDINGLCDEYLRLAYHGLRAKEKNFNAKTDTSFDPAIGKINIIPQDIGRVLLNLINNAFYAVDEKRKLGGNGYMPRVSISTRKGEQEIFITVSDNGQGIPEPIVDKIFQPFFSTKPTGQGTGLGLSLSYDIVQAHGGEMKVETREGEGTAFLVKLPIQAP